MEIMRLQTTHLVNIQLEKKDRMKPHELMPFPWDRKAVIGSSEPQAPFTDEEAREFEEKFAKTQWKPATLADVQRITNVSIQ